MRTYLLEVEREFKKLANHAFKTSNDRFNIPRSVGATSKTLNARLKHGFSFSGLPDAQQWMIWNFILRNCHMHEAQMAAIRFAEDRATTNGKREWNILRGWVDFVDNWAHSDVLSKVYSFLLEHDPKLVEPTLRQWNHSRNPWKRRASVVSTIYYASPRRTPPSLQIILSLVKPLLRDPDPYVQKGVGWQLREAYNLWPGEILKFLESHVLELPATTFSYATEKLTKKDKQRLKQKRTLWRKRP